MTPQTTKAALRMLQYTENRLYLLGNEGNKRQFMNEKQESALLQNGKTLTAHIRVCLACTKRGDANKFQMCVYLCTLTGLQLLNCVIKAISDLVRRVIPATQHTEKTPWHADRVITLVI